MHQGTDSGLDDAGREAPRRRARRQPEAPVPAQRGSTRGTRGDHRLSGLHIAGTTAVALALQAVLAGCGAQAQASRTAPGPAEEATPRAQADGPAARRPAGAVAILARTRDPNVDRATLARVLAAEGLAVERTYRVVPGLMRLVAVDRAEALDGRELTATIERLMASGLLAYAEPDRVVGIAPPGTDDRDQAPIPGQGPSGSLGSEPTRGSTAR